MSLSMRGQLPNPKSGTRCGQRRDQFLKASIVLLGVLISVGTFAYMIPLAHAEQSDRTPAVVQPGAPGQPSKVLPPSTRATLPPRSEADVEFMQGMIMHHAQAVEMAALI